MCIIFFSIVKRFLYLMDSHICMELSYSLQSSLTFTYILWLWEYMCRLMSSIIILRRSRKRFAFSAHPTTISTQPTPKLNARLAKVIGHKCLLMRTIHTHTEPVGNNIIFVWMLQFSVYERVWILHMGGGLEKREAATQSKYNVNLYTWVYLGIYTLWTMLRIRCHTNTSFYHRDA